MNLNILLYANIFFCTDKNVTVWFFIFSGIKIDEREFSCQNLGCERKQLIRKCDINSGMWRIWRSHRLERDGIYTKMYGFVEPSTEKKSNQTKTAVWFNIISKKTGLGTLLLLILNAFEVKNGIHSETNTHICIYTRNVDGFTKRMFNKKKFSFFFILNHNEPTNAQKKELTE